MAPRPEMVLISTTLMRRLMEGRHTCNSLAAAVGRSRQLMAHLAYGRRTSTSKETAILVAKELDVPVNVLFRPGAMSDESSTTKNQEEVAE